MLYFSHAKFRFIFIFTHPWKETPASSCSPRQEYSEHYELDYLDCCRSVRSRLYLLPWKGKISRMAGMVALDRWIPYLFYSEHDFVGESDPDFTAGSGLSCVDGNRSSGNSDGGNLLFP